MAIVRKVSPGQRHQMIAEAAYFRAERRGFNGGDPVADWIEAEAEVDVELRGVEQQHVIERLELAVAAATEALDGLKKEVSKVTADARTEWREDAEKLKKLRDTLRRRVRELREQGGEAGHKAKEQAEKIRREIGELVERVGVKIRR